MQWDASPNAGFCPPDVTPWLPVAADYRKINVAVEGNDPHSLLSLTHALLHLRRATPALSLGSYRPVAASPDDCFLYLRQHGLHRYLIALNFCADEQRIALPTLGSGHLLLSTFLDRQEAVNLSDFRLRGYEGSIIKV
jgi:alpha-glucosidase